MAVSPRLQALPAFPFSCLEHLVEGGPARGQAAVTLPPHDVNGDRRDRQGGGQGKAQGPGHAGLDVD